ncbi:MAG: hypothetical protein V3T05_01760 [Myxococcota bacterium]
MSKVHIKVARGLNSEVTKGYRWFTSLTRVLENSFESGSDGEPSLQHSLQFYGLYARTGDMRYLKLCDDFLKSSLAA